MQSEFLKPQVASDRVLEQDSRSHKTVSDDQNGARLRLQSHYGLRLRLLYACARYRSFKQVEGTESGDRIVSASDTRENGMTREKRGRRRTKVLIAAAGNRSSAWYACSLVPTVCLSEPLVISVPGSRVARIISKSACTFVDTLSRPCALNQADQKRKTCSLGISTRIRTLQHAARIY